jgi:uncharacterized protein
VAGAPPLLDPRTARRIIVDRQRYANRTRTATVAEVEATITRLGCVQIDSVSAVERAHRLTIAARVGRLPAGALNTLRRQGRVFEYWAHEASLLPIDDYPYFHAVRSRREHPWWGAVLTEFAPLSARILADVAERGPLSARAYGGAGGGYWQWTPAKRVFEALWTAGDLVVVERRGFERMYDLADRVVPARLLTARPDEAATLRHLVRRAIAARGIVTRNRLSDYYRLRGGARRLAQPVRELVDAGELIEARVGELDVLCDQPAAAACDAPPTPATPLLLCPFDNLIWDRVETRRLFGFDHMLEIYKRPGERVYGYYVLPLLIGDRIAGRVDLRSDRAAATLRILRVHWETRPAPAALARAASRLAHSLGMTRVAHLSDEASSVAP